MNRWTNRYFIEYLLLNIYLFLLGIKVLGVANLPDSYRLVIAVCITMLCLTESVVFLKRNIHAIPVFWIFTVLYIVYVFLDLFMARKASMDNILSYLFFPVVVLLFFESTFNNITTDDFEKIYSVQFIFQCLFFVMFIRTQVFSGISTRTHINAVYYIILMLPIVIWTKNYIVRIFSILLSIFAAILSLKVGGVLTVVIILLIYFGRSGSQKKIGILRMVKYVVPVLLLLTACIFLVRYFFNYNLFSKLLYSYGSGGSGRFELWKNTWNNITRSNFFKILFGHLSTSSTENALTLSAHNDYLEMLWRIGVLGFVVFLNWITTMVRMLRADKIYTICNNSLLINILVLAEMMMISQVVFVPSYASYLALWIGTSSAMLCRKKSGV